MSARSKWLDWEPETRIFSKGPEGAPTKPTKPGSVGFVGPYPGQIQKIEAEPDPFGDGGFVGSVGFVGSCPGQIRVSLFDPIVIVLCEIL
jgi:hypothetical protein